MKATINRKEKLSIALDPRLFDRIELNRRQYKISRSSLIRMALNTYFDALDRAENLAA